MSELSGNKLGVLVCGTICRRSFSDIAVDHTSLMCMCTRQLRNCSPPQPLAYLRPRARLIAPLPSHLLSFLHTRPHIGAPPPPILLAQAESTCSSCSNVPALMPSAFSLCVVYTLCGLILFGQCTYTSVDHPPSHPEGRQDSRFWSIFRRQEGQFWTNWGQSDRQFWLIWAQIDQNWPSRRPEID